MPGVSVLSADVIASRTLRAGWRTLLAAPDRIMISVIALSVPAIAVHVAAQHLIGITVAGSQECQRAYLGTRLLADCGPSNGRAQLALLVGLFAFFLVGHLVVAGLYRVALDAVDETPARGPFAGWNLLRVLPAALLLSGLLTISTLFLVLPGIVLGFFTRYTMLFVVDRSLGAFAALAASVSLVARRFVGELGFVVLAAAVLLAGLLVLGIGLYLAVPVVLIAQTIRYRSAHPAPAPAVTGAPGPG